LRQREVAPLTLTLTLQQGLIMLRASAALTSACQAHGLDLDGESFRRRNACVNPSNFADPDASSLDSSGQASTSRAATVVTSSSVMPAPTALMRSERSVAAIAGLPKIFLDYEPDSVSRPAANGWTQYSARWLGDGSDLPLQSQVDGSVVLAELAYATMLGTNVFPSSMSRRPLRSEVGSMGRPHGGCRRHRIA
jgi:hypothetical protein